MKEKFINFRYVFYPFLAFFLGITMARKLFAGSLEIILLVVVLFAILTTFLIIKKSYKPLLVLIAFFLIGNGFYFLGETTFNVKEYSSQVAVVGRVTDEIADYKYSMEIVLDEVKIDGKSSENLRLTLKNCPKSLNIGDFIAFEGSVERSRPFTLNSFNSKDLRSGVRYTAEVSYYDVVISDGYTKFDEKVRLAVKEKLYEAMSESNAGISYAVLFGDKSGVDESIESAYQDSGIIHVLTVSGLHVGFLISLVYFLLKLSRANKYVRFAVTTIFIFFYAYLCGFSPSVLRAGVMAIVLMLSKLFMRRYDNLNSLGVAGFAICIFSPLTALDIGFQMSFFCVYGIVVLSPTLTRIFAKFIPYKIASLLALSISAQLGIMPFLANFSASVNFLSIFANLIVVPAFSIIYPFLFLVGFLSTFIPFLSHLLCLVDYALIAVNAVATFFGKGFLSFDTSPFKTAITAIYFILLFAIGRFIMTKSLTKLAVFSTLALIMTMVFGFYLIPKPSENLLCYIGNKTSASVIVENDVGQRLIIGESYWLERYLITYDIGHIDGFIALDYLGNEDMENLAQFGIDSFLGNSENAGNSNFVTLLDNISYSFGEYRIKFISSEDESLGVNITFDEHNIFVASSANFDYNSLKSRGISPNIVFAKSLQENVEGITLATQNHSGDYSLAEHGNMAFSYNGQNWIMRGID